MFTCAVATGGCAPDGSSPERPVDSRAETTVRPPVAENADAEGHHEHHAPHGGSLVELGDEFAHLELVLDPTHGTLTVYVLDGEAEQSVRIAQLTIGLIVDAPSLLANRPLELSPHESALTGEKPGDASEFRFSHESLRGAERLTGRVLDVVVRGQTFRDVPFVAAPGDVDEH